MTKNLSIWVLFYMVSLGVSNEYATSDTGVYYVPYSIPRLAYRTPNIYNNPYQQSYQVVYQPTPITRSRGRYLAIRPEYIPTRRQYVLTEPYGSESIVRPQIIYEPNYARYARPHLRYINPTYAQQRLYQYEQLPYGTQTYTTQPTYAAASSYYQYLPYAKAKKA